MARRFLAQHLVHSSLLPGTFMLAQGLVYSTSLYFAHWDSLFFFFPSDCSADSVDISPVLWTILRVSNFPLRWCFFRIEVTSGIELSSIVSLEFHIFGFTKQYETCLYNRNLSYLCHYRFFDNLTSNHQSIYLPNFLIVSRF